jgi:hypothetical protein
MATCVKCQIFIHPRVSSLTNGQLIKGSIWSFIKITRTSCDKNKTLGRNKNKVTKPQGAIRYLTIN